MGLRIGSPLAPLSVEAADEVKNLRLVQQQQSTIKKQTIGAQIKLLTVLLNRTAAKRDQSRWATNVGGDADAKWLKD